MPQWRKPGSASPGSVAFHERAERKPPTIRYRAGDELANGKGGVAILRVWRTRINPARIDEYRRFETERFLPMLHKQSGFLAVLFLRQAEDHAASLIIWEDRGAVEAVKSSPSYRRAVRDLAGSDLLAGEQSEDVFEVEGGDLRAETLLGALGS
jgi:heme-degrading monooxygenase HmoA